MLKDQRSIVIIRALLLALCMVCAAAFGQSASLPASKTGGSQAGQAAVLAQDQAIESDLRSRFGLIESLSAVQVQSQAGVVRLSGETLEESDRLLAEKMARAATNVVEVQNNIESGVNLSTRLEPTLDRASARLQRLLTSVPLLFVALAVIWFANRLGRRLASTPWLYRWVGAQNAFLRDLIRQAVRLAVVLVGVLMALELLGATAMVGAVLGTAGVVGLAVGFAFKDLIENYIASVLLSIRQPFAPNDHVLISGEEGKVISLTARATVLIGMDGAVRMVPNATVFKGVIVNFTRNPQRRFEFELGVRPGEDLAQVHSVLLKTLGEIDGVLAEPAPSVSNLDYGDSRVSLRVRAWVDQRQHSLEKVRSHAVRISAHALEQAGIGFPESTLRLVREAPPESATVKSTPVLAREDTAVDTHLERQASRQRQQIAEDDLLHGKSTSPPQWSAS